MLRCRAPRRSQSSPHHHRNFPLSTGHIVDLGSLVSHLVHNQGDEVTEHDVDHGPKPCHCSTYGQACETSLGNGCVNDAVRAKFRRKTRENLEDRTGLSDILAHDQYARITAHLLDKRFTDCLTQSQLAWGRGWFLQNAFHLTRRHLAGPLSDRGTAPLSRT